MSPSRVRIPPSPFFVRSLHGGLSGRSASNLAIWLVEGRERRSYRCRNGWSLRVSRIRVWLMVVPLIVCGCEAAHRLLDRFISADGAPERELFERSGYGSSLMSPLLAFAGALVLAGLASHLIRGNEGRCRPPWWIFVVSPAVAFSLQEQVEFALAHGRPSLGVFLRVGFLVGLTLQVLFGLSALAVARCLFRVADVLVEIGRRPSCASVARQARRARACASERLASSHLLRSGDLTRGPPVLASI
jgi:hypothetical protein